MLLGLLAAQAGHAEIDRAALVRLGGSVVKVEAIQESGRYSIGSGVTVGPGRVVTNCHVTHDAAQLAIVRGASRWPVRLQLADANHDLCLLQVPGLMSTIATLGRVVTVKVGQPVTALGYTGGIELQISPGNVVALHRMDGSAVIQSNNWFNSGASGGGLFDDAGELVGILTFRLRGGAAHYFAAPVEWLRRMLDRPDSGEPVAPLGSSAIAYWQRPAETQPNFLRAAALEREGRWDELETIATRWSSTDGDDADAWYAQGLALAQLDRLQAALAALERAVEIEPASGMAWFRLGEVRVRLNQLGQARLALAHLETIDARLAAELMKLIQKERA